jgi:hypothetical protein
VFESNFDRIKNFLAQEVDNKIKFSHVTRIYVNLLIKMFEYFDKSLTEAEKMKELYASGYSANNESDNTPNPATATFPTPVVMIPGTAPAAANPVIDERRRTRNAKSQVGRFREKVRSSSRRENTFDTDYDANNEFGSTPIPTTVGGKRKINKSKRNESRRNKIAKKTRKY